MSEPAGEVTSLIFFLKRPVNNQRYGILGREEAVGPWPMRTHRSKSDGHGVYDGADEQPDILGSSVVSR